MNKIITIDGPTASGKGTLAKQIAKHFNLPYLNTGGLYRSIALYANNNNLTNFKNDEEIIQILNLVDFSNLENKELYTENIGFIASKIAIIKEVRDFLFNLQRNFALQENGSVLDGRDTGTVICPEASFKFYITASVEERAKRRFNEMQQKDKTITYDKILQQLTDRDINDKNRKNSPLIKAIDAIEIDTTNLNKEEVFNTVLSHIKF